MGYTHYWRSSRPFTQTEWKTITAEASRIIAKAIRGDYYSGKEDFSSATKCEIDEMGFRHGFNEEYAWRTFPHPEKAIPMQGAAIHLAGPSGEAGTKPIVNENEIALNGLSPEDYESFVLSRTPEAFDFCKTEYRPYDAVCVSILHVARTVAPDAINVTSDGGDGAIKLLF